MLEKQELRLSLLGTICIEATSFIHISWVLAFGSLKTQGDPNNFMQDVIVSQSCHVQNDTSKSSAIFRGCCCVSLGATKGISREIEKDDPAHGDCRISRSFLEAFCCMLLCMKL